MKLIQSPQRSNLSVTYTRTGDTLTIAPSDAAAYDVDLSGTWAKLEPDVEGGPLDQNGWLLAGEQDSNGNITLTVRAPHGPLRGEHYEPEPVELADGESVTFSGGGHA